MTNNFHLEPSPETPIHAQLKNVANVTHWHCLPRTRKMFRHFSDDTLGIETTVTRNLGSLIANSGAIRASQERAADVYGSDICRFSTGGTTQANEIAINAYLNPGDIVLCDWGCHVSHHSAIRMSGAFVRYLQPDILQDYSIVGTIQLPTILSALHQLRDQNALGRVKMLILTNSTYYGLYYKNLEEIMRQVLALVPDIVFLIDEAWFAHAPFHPLYRPHTAIATARRVQADRPRPDAVVRVISTASAHKGLPAPRQAAIINIVDERFDEEAFEEAFRSFSTTSWSLPILSGLAKAIKFARERGEMVIEDALASAICLRRRLPSTGVTPLDSAALIPEELRGSVGLDAMKVAYRLPTFVAGESYKTRLHEEEGCSLQMVTLNTALAMSVMGTSMEDVDRLVDGTARIVKTADRSFRAKKMPPIPAVGRFADAFAPKPDVGDLRSAYYAARRHAKVDNLDVAEIRRRLRTDGPITLATAFMPYPPGQQMAVHGHLATEEGMDFILSCLAEGYEVHGVQDGKMRVFREDAFAAYGAGNQDNVPGAVPPPIRRVS